MRRLLLSFGQLATSTVAGQLIGFAVLSQVSRRIGPANVGAYGFAIMLIAFFILPLVPGVCMRTVRDIARDRSAAAEIAGETLSSLVIYSVVIAAAIYALAPYIAPTPVAEKMMRILAVMAVVQTLSPEWLLRGLGRFRALAIVGLAGQVCYGIAALFLVTGGVEGAYRFAWLNVFGMFVTAVAAWLVCVRAIGRLRIHLDLRRAVQAVRKSAHFTTSLVMVRLYYSADFILLGFLATSSDVGQYTVAYRIPLAVLGLASVWTSVLFPHAAAGQQAALRRQLGFATTLSWIVVAPLCAGSILLATPLMVTLFGDAYAAAGAPFAILMCAASLAGLDANVGQVLLATGHERKFSLGVSVGAGCNLALNFLLIPAMGPAGAALATTAAEAVVLGYMLIALRAVDRAPMVNWSRVVRIGLATMIMAIVLLLLPADTFVIQEVAIGAIVYGVALLLTRAVTIADIRRRRLSGV